MGEGNPLNESRDNRGAWAQGLGVDAFSEEMEFLYFPGCYLAYDPRLKKVAQATVKVLKAAGVEFGILGSEENCCGRRASARPVTRSCSSAWPRRTSRASSTTGSKKILVSSPHCYHTFKNEYPEFRVNFEVIHMSQLLAQLLAEGRLSLGGEFAKKVTYHGPLLPGPPQRGLRRAPGGAARGCRAWSSRSCPRPASAACAVAAAAGASGWRPTRASDSRTCAWARPWSRGPRCWPPPAPYCIANFEDSKLTLEAEGAIEIKDIIEIVARGAVGRGRNFRGGGGKFLKLTVLTMI